MTANEVALVLERFTKVCPGSCGAAAKSPLTLSLSPRGEGWGEGVFARRWMPS